MAPQVGFGSEHGIDTIGCYWFYCNASNVFGQKCLLCTTDLSHVTVFGMPTFFIWFKQSCQNIFISVDCQ